MMGNAKLQGAGLQKMKDNEKKSKKTKAKNKDASK